MSASHDLVTSATEILEQIALCGAQITVKDDVLSLRADQPLPDELVDAIRQHKPELLALLSHEAQELTPDLKRAVALTQEVFSQTPKPQPNDGVSPDAREALRVIRKIAERRGILDTLAVADAMSVTVTALSGALVELECKRLIHPGDWTRCGTKIKLVTH